MADAGNRRSLSWARFAQPSAFVYARDDKIENDVVAGISEALRAGFPNAKALTAETDALAVWTAGFNATYQSELRSEKTSRAASIVSSSPDYYREAAKLLASETPVHANQTLRRWAGKTWSVLRLIEGVHLPGRGRLHRLENRAPFGRKNHSHRLAKKGFIAGLLLLPALLRKGAIR